MTNKYETLVQSRLIEPNNVIQCPCCDGVGIINHQWCEIVYQISKDDQTQHKTSKLMGETCQKCNGNSYIKK